MALTKELLNPYTGETVSAYCVIDWFDQYDKRTRRARFVMDCYARPCTVEERKSRAILPFHSQPFVAVDADFDTYMAPEVIKTSEDPTDPARQGYLYATRSVMVDGVETNAWATAEAC